MQVGAVNSSRYIPQNKFTSRDSDGGIVTFSIGSTHGIGEFKEPEIPEIITKATPEQKAELRRKYNINNIEAHSYEHESLMLDLKDMGLISSRDYEFGQMDVGIPIEKVRENAEIYNSGKILTTDEPEWLSALRGKNLCKMYEFSIIQHKENYYDKVSNKDIEDPMNFGLNDYAAIDSKTTVLNVLKEIFFD